MSDDERDACTLSWHGAEDCDALCICGHAQRWHAHLGEHHRPLYCTALDCGCSRYDEQEDGDDGCD